jgi:LDH2 family malate/lactate/ureidoglycolate dehydrogenase
MSSLDAFTRLEPTEAKSFCNAVFQAAGVAAQTAEQAAAGLWLTSMRGIDSHGIRLLPHYVAGLRGGRLNGRPSYTFTATATATGVLDADHTLGHAAGLTAMGHAIELAESAGIGVVTVFNSSHCGMLATYALEACRHRMMGFAVTHATPRLCSAGGVRPFFGNNPLCITAPMAGEAPFCYDGAQSSITMNEVRRRAALGHALPAGAAADESGAPVTEADRAIQLLGIGDYKGFGLAMGVEILCALLTGMPAGPDVSDMFADSFAEPRRLGTVVGALRIDAFVDPDEFEQRLGDMARRLRAEPPRDPSVPVQVPGDPEKRIEEERRRLGIPISEGDLESLLHLAGELGVEPPSSFRSER